MQLSALSRLCDVYRVISVAECNSTAEAFKALCGPVPVTFKEGLLFFEWSGCGSLEGLALGIASIATRVSGSGRARREVCSSS